MNDKDKKAIDKIVQWIFIKSLRDAIKTIYYEYKNSFNKIDFLSDIFNYIYKNPNAFFGRPLLVIKEVYL